MVVSEVVNDFLKSLQNRRVRIMEGRKPIEGFIWNASVCRNGSGVVVAVLPDGRPKNYLNTIRRMAVNVELLEGGEEE